MNIAILKVPVQTVPNQGYSAQSSKVAQHGSNARNPQHDGVLTCQQAEHTTNATYTEQRPGAQQQHNIMPTLPVWNIRPRLSSSKQNTAGIAA